MAEAACSTAGPIAEGFHWPAEWEPHERTWMGWPERPDNWREGGRPAQQAFVDVATAISLFEPVTVCANRDQLGRARRMLPERVQVVHIPQDDAWFRDSGPTFVVKDTPDGERQVAGVHWQFNAWGGTLGGLYPSWERDRKVGSTILKMVGARRYPADLVMEGGSIHTDGEGTLLTTEECLLNPNRNPTLSKEQIESWLHRMLGVQKVIWLPRGLEADDDTDGHVDNFACFAAPGVVLLAWTDDTSDPQYTRSADALSVLERETDARGRRFRVVKLPCPPVLRYTPEEVSTVQATKGVMPRKAGERLAASYVNFYFCNGGLIMPGFGGEAADADARAKAVLQEVFPKRRVLQVATREVVLGGGNIHCITQQQPVGRPAPPAARALRQVMPDPC